MSKDFLSEIITQKRDVVAKLRSGISMDKLRARALEIRKNAEPHRLLRALETESTGPKIIAEFKRKSPSAGIIRADLSPVDVARRYDGGGACAISVLTDENFDGSIDDLIAIRSTTRLPILRKDFIIDPIQIYEAAIAGADAVLLIAAILDQYSLTELRKISEDELGLDALVEVHTSEELRRAANAGARLIGVNNRNLETFEVSLNTSERLIAEAPPNALMLSESGLKDAQSLHCLQTLGFRGFLIGEALMRASDPEAALRELIAHVEDRQLAQAESHQR